MTRRSITPFRRLFVPDDEMLFAELVAGLLGKRCSQVRETYAEGIVVDFGMLAILKPPTYRGPGSLEGEWQACDWGCDTLIMPAGGSTVADSRVDFKAVLAGAESLVGDRVSNFIINPSDLSLKIAFHSGAWLTFQTDSEEADMDQWSLQLPDDLAIVAEGAGWWRLEESPSIAG